MSKLLNLTNEQVVERAKSCLRDDSKYRLEYPNGGADPTKPKPYDRVKIAGAYFNCADCIGFALWCSGISRKFTGTANIPPFPDTPSVLGSYINCQSLVEEAVGFPRRRGQPNYPGGRFFRFTAEPVVGDLIVFWGKPHGHVGIISFVPKVRPKADDTGYISTDDWITADPTLKRDVLKVIHCSPSNERREGRAVAETDGRNFKGKNAYFVHLNREGLLRGAI